jgi:hypothetical protein
MHKSYRVTSQGGQAEINRPAVTNYNNTVKRVLFLTPVLPSATIALGCL